MMDTLAGLRVGALALARPTFDVPFAESVARAAFASLDTLGARIVGPRDLLFDAAAAETAVAALEGERLDALLVLQVTFTDASMTVALARRITAPLVLWSFPEPRTGGRLRLNALCGINLAGHALGRAGRRYGYVHAPPDAPDLAARLGAALAVGGELGRPRPRQSRQGIRSSPRGIPRIPVRPACSPKQPRKLPRPPTCRPVSSR